MGYKKKSIKTKYIQSGIAICILSLLMVSIISYAIAYNITRDQSDRRIKETALKNSNELNYWFDGYRNVMENLVNDIEITEEYNKDYLYKLTKGKLDIYKHDVLDFYIAFDDDSTKIISGRGWEQPIDYDVHTRGWYKQAFQKKGVIFTEPYLDADTGRMVITMAKTINKGGRPIGALAADIVITNVVDTVKKYKLSEYSYSFLLDNQGEFLAHPKKDFIPDEKGIKSSKDINWPQYSKLIDKIKEGNMSKISIKDYDGKPKHFILSRIDSTGWIFGIALTNSEYQKPLKNLLYGFLGAFLVSMMVGLAIMFKIVNGMVKPIKSLSDTVKCFSTIDMSVRSSIDCDDEIGELSNNFNEMADTIQEYSISLEQKVEERTRELQEKNEKIMESIDYAERIQRSILPDLSKRLGIPKENCFVIWNPKDTVGGDMYWCRGDENYALLALADCTGHGVPGALMTMALSSILDGLPREMEGKKPSEIMYVINSRLKETLGQNEAEAIANDGADIALVLIDKKNRRVLFSGAKLSLFLCHKGEIFMYKGSKHSVGYSWHKDVFYEDYEIEWVPSDVFYLTTDGLLDQNMEVGKGGIGKAKFKKLLQNICEKSIGEQKCIIDSFIYERISKVEQRDDIALIGFKL